MEDYNGKLLVRMPIELHKKLALAAKDNKTSLNQYIVYLLSKNEFSIQDEPKSKSVNSLDLYQYIKEDTNMAQTAESGRRGNEVGRLVGQTVAAKLGMQLEEGSNKGVFNNNKAVIKSARIGNSQFGVTNRMLQEIQYVILAKEVSVNNFELYSVDSTKLINAGRPTASRGSSAGKVTNFSVSNAVSIGEHIGQVYSELPYPPNCKLR